jgi:hypothetical protein
MRAVGFLRAMWDSTWRQLRHEQDARWRLGGGALALLFLIGLGLSGPATTPPSLPNAPAPSPLGQPNPSGPPGPGHALGATPDHTALANSRLQRAQEVLDNYRHATRYPPDSRPLKEQPDQAHPFAPISESRPLRQSDGTVVPGVRIITTQSQIFLSGPESVRFTVAAQDENGKTLPLTVTRAVAFDLPDPRQAAGRPQVAVAFNDVGADPDLQAGDGTLSARFTPASQGYADYAGTLRVAADLRTDDASGSVFFDVIYHPSVPAQWLGVQDVVRDGSLDFDLGAQVLEAGRYVVSGRVFDATGAAVAVLSFNEEVGTGSQVFRLRLFGKLIRDTAPVFPLTLRDVDGYLLYADTFPDRAMLPRREGTVHVTGRYAAEAFSSTEWTSEERSRYLAEYERDVQRAQSEGGTSAP